MIPATWIFTLLVFSTHLFAGTEVYFSPSSDCENRIVKAIQDSTSEITAAVYSINNRKIVDALTEAKNRGVKIRILTDRVQASQRSSKVLEMIQNGLPVRVHSKFKIEHNKFGIYDGKWVSTGSFNWTGPAARSNSENCVFLDEPKVISSFQARFNELWERNTQEGSNAYLAKMEASPRRKNGKRTISSPPAP